MKLAKKNRILILGGGFAGVFTAKRLAKISGPDVEIVLVNERNFFVFQPLLPEVAAGAITATDAISPLRLLLRDIQIRQAKILAIDFDKNKVTVVQGTGRIPVDLEYDHLVIALGQTVNLGNFPGMADHGLTIKNLGDAHRLRNKVIWCLENAENVATDRARRELLTFVVVGAGFSGVETAGEIKALIDHSLKFYPNIDASEIRVLLVEYADRILRELPEDLADYAKERLQKQGIEVFNGVGTDRATVTSVSLTNGEVIPTRTIVATIGTAPHDLVAGLPLEFQWGRIKVDRRLRAQSDVHPRNNVWAIGDAALIPLNDNPQEPKDFAPPTAQFAVREGTRLADNIMAEIKGQPLRDFAYTSKGALASLGTSKAVAQVYGIKMSGTLAWLLWRSFYISFLPGMAARIRVLINWFLNSFAPRNIVQVHHKTDPATRTVHYNAGDIVFAPGWMADGFYTVLSGSFDLEVAHPDTGEVTKRILEKGDHFGERVLLGTSAYTGLVKAREDATVLWIAKDDFQRFTRGFPRLNDYFERYIDEHYDQEMQQAGKKGEKTE